MINIVQSETNAIKRDKEVLQNAVSLTKRNDYYKILGRIAFILKASNSQIAFVLKTKPCTPCLILYSWQILCKDYAVVFKMNRCEDDIVL